MSNWVQDPPTSENLRERALTEREHAGAESPMRTAVVASDSPNGPEPIAAVTRHNSRSVSTCSCQKHGIDPDCDRHTTGEWRTT